MSQSVNLILKTTSIKADTVTRLSAYKQLLLDKKPWGR